MADQRHERRASKCISCGYEAPAGSDDWGSTDHPSLGSLTQCPDCGSTDVHELS